MSDYKTTAAIIKRYGRVSTFSCEFSGKDYRKYENEFTRIVNKEYDHKREKVESKKNEAQNRIETLQKDIKSLKETKKKIKYFGLNWKKFRKSRIERKETNEKIRRYISEIVLLQRTYTQLEEEYENIYFSDIKFYMCSRFLREHGFMMYQKTKNDSTVSEMWGKEN